MTDSEEQHLHQLIGELDRLVPEQDAWVKHAGEFVGNRSGYLRFGIELLKAASQTHSPEDGDAAMEVDLTTLVSDQPEIGPAQFTLTEERDEEITALSRPWKDRVGIVGYLVIGFFLVFAAIVGIGTIFKWIAP